MTKKLTSPPYWDYTLLERIKKFIPSAFTQPQVVVKEFLDNACDAAEKKDADGFVDIQYVDDVIKITNHGTITTKEFDIITDFFLRISEKYIKRSFIRGQIGHGLKIALMLALTNENKIIFDSDGFKHTITLKDRKSWDPKKVLELESIEDKVDNSKTTVSVPIGDILTGSNMLEDYYTSKNINNERFKVENYINNYIALNPQITFRYNHITYDSTVKVKKSDKVDIFSYNLKAFKEFAQSYHRCGYTIADFIELFNIKKSKYKKILKECEDLEVYNARLQRYKQGNNQYL